MILSSQHLEDLEQIFLDWSEVCQLELRQRLYSVATGKIQEQVNEQSLRVVRSVVQFTAQKVSVAREQVEERECWFWERDLEHACSLEACRFRFHDGDFQVISVYPQTIAGVIRVRLIRLNSGPV